LVDTRCCARWSFFLLPWLERIGFETLRYGGCLEKAQCGWDWMELDQYISIIIVIEEVLRFESFRLLASHVFLVW